MHQWSVHWPDWPVAAPAMLPGPQAVQPGLRLGHRRLQNGASNKQAVGRDVVGEDWLQQRPGGTAP
jgi:hypothetical protein